MAKSSLNIYVTTFNREKYLKFAIDSILAQTYRDFNIYILDNCSEDNTEQLINSYSDSRVHYIRHKHNIGGLANIKYAFEHNEADYFMVFHDDDLMNPEMIEIELNYLEKNPDVSIVSSISGHVDEEGKWVESATSSVEIMMSQQNVSEKVYEDEGFLKAYLYEGANIVFPSVMYRNSFIKGNNLGLIEMAGPSSDTELMLEICRSGGKIAIINKQLMNTRMHKSQDSFQSFGIMYRQLFTYLRNDTYFSELLKKYKSGCEILYVNLSKIIAVYLARSKFTFEQARQNEADIWCPVGGKRIDHFKYKCFETAYRIMPTIVSKAVDKYLSRER